MPDFELKSSETEQQHVYEIYDCLVSEQQAVEELAQMVRDLYVEPDRLRAALEAAIVEIDGLTDRATMEAEIERAIREISDAVVPVPGTRLTQPQLDLARNELAEVIAYAVVEQVYEAVIPARRIREKEIPQLPTRGLDLMAIQPNPDLRLFICEVKASEDKASPPGVVATGEASLQGQLLAFTRDRTKVTAELNWVKKHCQPQYESMVARTILQWVRHQLPITVVPVLVRTEETHGRDDFGPFYTSPEQFAPAVVRFCITRLPGGIQALANQVYEKARVT